MLVYSYGRISSCPARLWERALRQRGDVRTRRYRNADLVVIGAGAAAWSEGDIGKMITASEQAGRSVLSERMFLRSIGLMPPPEPETMAYCLEEVAVLAKLPLDTVRLLAVFDVVQGDDERFGFRAIKAAGVAARLMAQGVSLAEIVAACVRLRQSHQVSSPLSQFQLGPDEGGSVVLRFAEGMAELDGQLRLGLDGSSTDVEQLLTAADHARDAGQTSDAEGLLRRALAGSPNDPEILFELGSLLCEETASAEGIALLQKAAILKPNLADAWFNIGCALERQHRPEEASRAYLRAVAADPTYPDPLYNLGMLDLDRAAYEEAVHWLERYLNLDNRGEWAAKARKGVMLARLSMSVAKGG
jgi:tetratricopeptide (TPR) repeat protein